MVSVGVMIHELEQILDSCEKESLPRSETVIQIRKWIEKYHPIRQPILDVTDIKKASD